MMDNVRSFVKAEMKGLILNGLKVLDIGSFDVNGSVRDIFIESKYIGIDMRQGRNVDIVSNSHFIPFPDNYFDIVTCLEMLEHDSNPFVTMLEIHRVLRPYGRVVVTACGIFFPKHDYPSDYWRFTSEAFMLLLSSFQDVKTFEDATTVFGCGIKGVV